MITENSTKQEILNSIAEDQEVVRFLGGIECAQEMEQDELYKKLCWFLELSAPLVF